MIKYIGSKRVLVPLITKVIQELEPTGSVVDLFSGTARVGHGLKSVGFQVFSNDINAYAATLARCYVQADAEDVAKPARALIAEMGRVPAKEGYFTQTFCVEGRYFQPKNGALIDAMRDWIEERGLEPELEAVLLVSLMEAADRVDSTTGVQMAFLKKWAPRAHNDLELRMPDVLARPTSGKGRAFQLEAQDAASNLTGDIGYLDPPYNQHKYVGNYHIWETLVRWDEPEAYGVARKRVDCRERKSSFNSKPRIRSALADVVANLDVRHLVVSFNNEGYIPRNEMIETLSKRGEVFVIERDFKRYVGAQIGIYNPGGAKVGKVSHLTNKEFLFVVPENPDAMRTLGESFTSVDQALSRMPEALLPKQDEPASPSVDSHRRQRLVEELRRVGSLSSREARQHVGGTASELRAMFHELLVDDLIHKSGQRRGTRYHWGEEQGSPTSDGPRRVRSQVAAEVPQRSLEL